LIFPKPSIRFHGHSFWWYYNIWASGKYGDTLLLDGTSSTSPTIKPR
jgi:hypothetical protein